MHDFTTVLTMLSFCLRLAREKVSNSLCCLAFGDMMFLCNLHLSDGIIWMPKYMYSSFCVRVGKFF